MKTSILPNGWRGVLVPAAWAALAVALFFCYLRVSRTQPEDSYGAVFTLQAWEMLHGNGLLHGWWLSDVSFYTTELPEYMAVDLVRGLSPDVVHVAAAMTFTFLLLTAALLAKGGARGREGVVAALIGAGIMLSPQPGNGVFVLLLAPDHVGTCVPVLLAWLILDRAPPRWYVPAAVAVLLAWALVADPLVLLIAVLPLVVVCAVRAGRAVTARRVPASRTVEFTQALRSQWYEVSLIAAGLAAAGLAALALSLIRGDGGFVVSPVASALTSTAEFPGNVHFLAHGLLLLFGADISGQHGVLAAAALAVHLAGLALAAWAVCLGVWRFTRQDRVVQLLVTAILLNLAAFLLWSRVTDITSTREMVAVLPFCAVLAGRLLAPRLLASRLAAVRVLAAALPVVVLGYLASLAQVAAHAPQPPQYQQLANWLTAHGFRYGIGASWLGSVVTLGSGERVQLRPVRLLGNTLAHSEWESKASWYDPRLHDANFAVLVGDPPQPPVWSVRAAFGSPARTYRVGSYTVLVWNENLLTKLR